ncbi:MAG: hypothetical protein AAF664_01715 [Planctomycetota bacterium]
MRSERTRSILQRDAISSRLLRRGYTLIEISVVGAMTSTVMAIVLFWFGTTFEFRNHQRKHREASQRRWALSERIEGDLFRTSSLRLDDEELFLDISGEQTVYKLRGASVERRSGSSVESFEITTREERLKIRLVQGIAWLECSRGGKLVWRKSFMSKDRSDQTRRSRGDS